MNKVFKVIWSEARNAYVVVSEMAKSHGTKSCSTKKLLAMLIATGVMTCASVAPVMADNPAPKDTKIEVGKDAKAKGGDSVAIGNGAEAKAANGIAIGYKSLSGDRGWGVAVGGNTQAIGTYSVALGQTAKVLEYEGIAIGHTSLSEGSGAIAIGKSTNAKGTASLAFGNDAKALEEASIAFGQGSNSSGNSSIAVGRGANATGQSSIAIGSQAVADKAYSVVIGANTYKGTTGTGVTGVGQQTQVLGDYAGAFGMGAKANAERATAIGSYANAMAAGSVALGAGSTVKREAGAKGYDPLTGKESTLTSFAWKSTKGAVSVGGVGVTRQIINVAAGSEDTDAVNVAQLKKVGELAEKGWQLSANGGKATKVAPGAKVDFSGDDENITVSKEGTSIKVKLNRNLYVDNVNAGDYFFSAERGIGFGGKAYITQSGLNANDKVITNVAEGVYNTDAVNVGQLKEVEDVANKGWNLSANGGEATNVAPGATVDFSGDDENITVSKEGTSVQVNLNKDLHVNNVNAGDYFFSAERGIGFGGSAYITQSGLNANNNVISNVAAGEDDTDAVNVSQLNKVSVEAGKHSVVTEGANITVTPEQAEDGRMQYNVALKNDIKLAGDNDYTYVNISGSNGSVWASSSVAAGNVIMDGTTATISGLGNTTTSYDGFANGEGKAATEEQLKEVSKVAENANQGWNLSTNGGKASKVAPGETVDISGDKNIKISNDGTNVKVKLNENIDVNSVQTNALNSKYNLSVGTMAENGIMPFFVNSTGDFYAAHNKFHVDKDGKVTATAGEIGNVVLQNGVYYGHSTLQDGSLLLTDDNGNHSYIDAKSAKLGKVTVAEDGKITGVAAGAITADSTDAVNGSQLHAVATEAGKHSKVVNGSNINVEEFDNDGQKIYKVNLNKDIMLGDLTGKYVSISGTNGTIETTGYIATEDRVYADKGGKLADIDVTGDKISNGASSIVLDGSNVKVNDKVTIDQNGKISGVAKGEISSTSTDAINGSQLHQTNENVAANRADIDKNKADIAALDNRVTKNEQDIKQNAADIAQNKADIATNKADIATNKANIAQNAADIKKVEELAKKHTTVTAGDNITVTEDTNKDGGKEYKVALDKDIKLDSVTTGQTVMNNDGLKVGKDVSVTATAVTAGKTSISDEGVKVGDKTYISDKGLNANDQKVTNVKAGDISETSKDAVNGSQLYKTNQEVANNTNRINQLGSRVNKVGAGAAALAALHPMDFDPDDKLTFSAGYGNYGGENAAAIGAYYRPDEKVMFSVGGTVGNGENMVNAGVSFSLDRTNHVSNSRTALAREVIDLRGQLAVMGAKMAKMEKAFGMLDETKTKLFPDVPANHWAYEYIAKLAGNGYIEGYPDGNFGGDRLMTRYEFAAMLYRAIENGAALEEKIIKEFEPELGRIRVDRISGEDGDRDKIERVRVNDTKGERDHYGNKLAK